MRRHHLSTFVKRASWKAGAVSLAALLALALVAQTSPPQRAEASVGPNIASQAITLLVSVPNPLGVSSHDLNVMRDGFSGPNALGYDTWDGNNAAAGEDFYGYGWAVPQAIARVAFTEGAVFPDGGFFTTLRLETSPDGVTWTTVASGNDASPPYPNANDGIPFNTYQWDFIPAITAQYLRVIGVAGGTAEFTTVSEFQVFTSGGVVPVDNIAPYADFVGTNAAAPTGNGSHDIEVLRDGIKPAPGSFNPSLQYDTNTGSANPAEVYFLYRWPQQRTITRIELYGGQETAAGGWWTDLRIELSSNGNDWNPMKTAADAVPVYPNASSQSFNHYTFAFATPRSGKYMRIIGPAGGTPGYISASEIEVYAELEPGEGGYYPNIAPSAAEVFGSGSVGLGQGAPSLQVINDGYAPGVDAIEPLAQFDTWHGFFPAGGPDNYAYRFAATKVFTGAAYTEGMQFTDGGWFNGAPHIEVSSDGGTWTTVPATISPTYVNDDGHNFNRYVFAFAAPVSGQYIRLIGIAGGASEFTSVAEFEVYGGDITASNSVNLSIAQTVDNPTPNVGNQVTFTVTLTSHNLTTATGITITDVLPAGLTLVSWVTSNGTYAADVWSVPSLAGNGSATLTIVATVNAGTEGQTITNNAAISTVNQVNTGTPASASSSITVSGAPDVQITVTVDNPNPTVGTNVTITIKAKNVGNLGATGVSVPWTFPLPAGLTLVSVTPNSGTPWAVGNLAVDEEKTLVIVATVDGPAGTPIIVSAGPVVCTEGCSDGPETVTITPTILLAPNVQISVTVDNPNPTVGTNVTITIKAKNIGTAGATGVSVPWTLPLPAGLTLISVTPNSGTPWNVGSLAVDEEKTLVIVATVNGPAGPPIIISAGPVVCIEGCGSGPGTVTITPAPLLGDPNIAPLADLLITSVPTPLGGGNHNLEVIRDISYPVPGTNDAGAQYDTFDGFAPSGPDYFGYRWPARYHFSGAKFVDGMHFGDGGYFTSAPSIEISDDGVTWTAVTTVTGYQGNVAPNFTAYPVTFSADGRYLRLIGTPAGGAEFSSIAELEVYGTLIPTAPDVRITVTVDNPTPTVGTNVTITIKAKNVGTAGTTGVSVPWTLPAGLTLVSATPNTGSPWNVGDLAVDEEQTLVIIATVTGTPGQPIVVTAGPVTCTGSCGTGPGTGTVTITPTAVLGDPNIAPLANLLITSVPAPLGGGNHNLEIIRDISYPTPGTNDAGAQYDTFDGFAPSGPDYFGYRWPDRYHFTGAKFVDGMHFFDGGYFTSAPTIEVSDDGVTWTPIATVTGYQGNVAPNFTAYDIPFTADGRYLRLIGTPAGGAEFSSIAELEVYGTLIPGAPDVRITVTVDNPTPTVGTNVTITINAKNVGTVGATGVSVPWTLPAGLTLVSTTPNTGSPWTVGDLAVDEEQTLVIVATVTGAPGQPIVVTAGPVTCTTACGTGGTGTVTITPTAVLGDPNIAPFANLLITSVPAPLGGGNHNLEIIRDISYPTPGTNDAAAQYDTFDFFAPSGPDYFGYRWPNRYHFTGAKFVDGMHFFDGGYFTAAPTIEVSDDGVTWTPVATVTGYQGNAAPNFTAYDIPFTADGRYLRLIGTAAGGAEFTSIAELEVYGTALPGSPNVNITVTGIPANPLPGDTVTVTVTATNIGDAGASGIVIDSPVPGGLTLVSATPTQGTYGGGTWTLGGLPAGGSQTLTLVLTVDAGTGGTSITHTATITSMNEPNPGTGTGSATFNVGIPGAPNVTITVTVDNPTPTVGTNVTITIKAKNVGTAGATGVLVPWTLPGGLTLVSTTPNTGSPWNVGSLAVDEEQTLVIVATVTGAAGQPLVVNAGPVTCSQPCGSGGGSVTITPTVALAPAVTITVTVDNPTPQVGTNVTITIKAKNVGTAGAMGVLVPWTLPAGLTLVSTTPNTGSPWNVGSLAVNEEKTLVIVATVTGAAGQPLVVNAGPVTCDQPCGSGGGSVTITPVAAPTTDVCSHADGNLIVNGCFESNTVMNGWDLYKTGTLVGWTVEWLGANPCQPSEPGYTGAQLEQHRNILGAAAEGQQYAELDSDCNSSTNDTRSGEAGSVKIWQDIPTVAGNWYKVRYSYKSRPDTSSGTNGVKAYWAGNNVATTGHASSWTVKEVVVQATGSVTRVMFADNGTPDSLGSFIDDIRVTPTSAPVVNREVDLSWTVSDSTPNVNQNVTFVLKADNDSGSSATGIVIGVTLPSGLTIVSVTPNQGTYAAGVWTLGTLSGGAYKTLTVVAKPAPGTAGQTLTVTGTITAMDQTNTGTNSASKSVTVNGSSGHGGWMNVGGNIREGSRRYTWGGSISCDGIEKKSFEYHDHYRNVDFNLATVTSVVCSTTSGVSHGQPSAGFNTLVLVGLSSDGKRVEATFIDAGEPGRDDTVNIKVFNAGGTLISSVSGNLDGGNLQAHKGDETYNSQGYDRDGYDRDGYDHDGYDHGGCDRHGSNRNDRGHDD